MSTQDKKKVSNWVPLCCTVGVELVTVNFDGCVKFEINGISLYTKNDSEQIQSISLSLSIFHIMFFDISTTVIFSFSLLVPITVS